MSNIFHFITVSKMWCYLTASLPLDVWVLPKSNINKKIYRPLATETLSSTYMAFSDIQNINKDPNALIAIISVSVSATLWPLMCQDPIIPPDTREPSSKAAPPLVSSVYRETASLPHKLLPFPWVEGSAFLWTRVRCWGLQSDMLNPF